MSLKLIVIKLGHKTDSASQRYNIVTEEEIKGMKWLE